MRLTRSEKILLCLKWFPCHCWKLFQSIYLPALELRRKISAGDKSTQLAHQVFPGKTLALCLSQGDSTHNFSWLMFQRVCNASTKWARALHLKIVAIWFIWNNQPKFFWLDRWVLWFVSRALATETQLHSLLYTPYFIIILLINQ